MGTARGHHQLLQLVELALLFPEGVFEEWAGGGRERERVSDRERERERGREARERQQVTSPWRAAAAAAQKATGCDFL